MRGAFEGSWRVVDYVVTVIEFGACEPGCGSREEIMAPSVHSISALCTFVLILKVRIAAFSVGFPQHLERLGWGSALCEYFRVCIKPAVQFLDAILNSPPERARFVRSK